MKFKDLEVGDIYNFPGWGNGGLVWKKLSSISITNCIRVDPDNLTNIGRPDWTNLESEINLVMHAAELGTVIE